MCAKAVLPKSARDSRITAMRCTKTTPTLFLVVLAFVLNGITPRAQDKSPAPSKTGLEIPATDDGLPGQGPIRRQDWFRNLWKERRTRWAGRVQQDHNAIVLLGDSITQGWGEDFTAWFPG